MAWYSQGNIDFGYWIPAFVGVKILKPFMP